MGKKKTANDYLHQLRMLKEAGMEYNRYVNDSGNDQDLLLPLAERVENILHIINKHDRPIGNMLFFIMYDIESNKVRYNVAKYLIKQGCTRIQKSVFLADLDTATYKEIRDALTDIQALYDNHDSIVVCPVPTDVVRNMRVIGKDLNIDIITHATNTLFF